MNLNWIKKSTYLVLYYIIFIILFLLVAEFIMHSVNKDKGVDFGKERVIRLKEWAPNSKSILIPDDKLMTFTDSLIQKEYIVNIDSNGFINPSKIYDTPDKSIFFVGGSTTECLYVDENKRFPYLVGRYIENNTSLKINSYNAGVSGNHSLHSIDIILNKIIPLSPDYVVFMHNFNDLSINVSDSKAYWNHIKNPVIIYTESGYIMLKKTIKGYFPILNSLVRNAYYSIFLKELDGVKKKEKRVLDEEKVLNGFRKNLELFVQISKIYQFTPVLMTQFNRIKEVPDKRVKRTFHYYLESIHGVDYKVYFSIYEKMNDVIREVARKENVKLIDLDKIIPKDKKYIYDSIHLNTVGSEYVAKIIFNEILQDIDK